MRSEQFDGEIWDEFQWESHLEEMELKTRQLKKFIESNLGQPDSPPRWLKLLNESVSEQDALDAFIEEELMFEEAYFPDDDEEFDGDDDFEEEDDLFFDAGFDDSDELDADADDDPDFAGEDWKYNSEQYALTDYGSIENLKVYTNSHHFGSKAMKIAESIPSAAEQTDINAFITDTIQISAKLAAGYSFGFDRDVLGGNIAYCKKALYAANSALARLRDMKNRGYFSFATYYSLHADLHELRNDIGIYIQDLRDKFNEPGF
jgi:hypothetical protein